MNVKIRVIGVMLGLLLALSGRSEAAPLLTGAFSITGNFLPVLGVDGTVVGLDDATGIDFINIAGSSPTPGAAGLFFVNSASGDFSGLTGHIGSIRDFTFSGAGSTNFPSVPPLLTAFESVGSVTFDLTSIFVVMQNEDFLALKGTGTFNKAGFDATAGTFTFSANQADSTFSFSSSEKATTVPEPASALLFGIGTTIVGWKSRRRTPRD
jgi:hypothetical protein